VWAIGDLRGGPRFTHTARDDADIVYRSVFRGEDRSTTGRVVPHAVFVDPEVASVGLTEAQAHGLGYDVLIGRQEFSGVPKARAIGNSRGLVKFVADAPPTGILGCHIAGPDAGNLIHEAVIAMVANATYSDIARAIHVHPTIAEGTTPPPAESIGRSGSDLTWTGDRRQAIELRGRAADRLVDDASTHAGEVSISASGNRVDHCPRTPAQQRVAEWCSRSRMSVISSVGSLRHCEQTPRTSPETFGGDRCSVE